MENSWHLAKARTEPGLEQRHLPKLSHGSSAESVPWRGTYCKLRFWLPGATSKWTCEFETVLCTWPESPGASPCPGRVAKVTQYARITAPDKSTKGVSFGAHLRRGNGLDFFAQLRALAAFASTLRNTSPFRALCRRVKLSALSPHKTR